MKEIPNYLKELLLKEYNEEIVNKIIEGYQCIRKTTFRINLLKGTKEVVLNELNENNIKYIEGTLPNSFIIEQEDYQKLIKTKIFNEGMIYLQSLSSMVPPYVLNPNVETDLDILDMTAAPGSKTSLISEMVSSNKNIHIMAVEMEKIRFERLKFNLNKLGCINVNVMNLDACKLDDFFSFDKILLDAPCSGSGTLSIYDNSLDKFSINLVKNSSNLQKKLLRKAIRLLKPNHYLVYSTCSILSLENEDVINEMLKEQNIEIIPINGYDQLPTLPSKIKGVLKIMPNELYEGFFVCMIKKLK